MNFYDLEEPAEEHVPPNAGKWFVVVDTDKTTFRGGLLNDGSDVKEIARGFGANNQFYFNTKLGAHLHADMYYKSHGLPYPYQDEWDQAILDNVGKKAKTNIIESQVMEFD